MSSVLAGGMNLLLIDYLPIAIVKRCFLYMSLFQFFEVPSLDPAFHHSGPRGGARLAH